MPVLEDGKHEIMAQALARGMRAEAAHEAAGYKKAMNASKYLKRYPHILERAKELKQIAAEKNSVTVEWLQRQWIDLAERARQEGDHANEARALENLSKYAGFYEKDNRQKAVPIIREADKALLQSFNIYIKD